MAASPPNGGNLKFNNSFRLLDGCRNIFNRLWVFCLLVIAVGELHVHAVSAQEGPAVQRCVDVGRVWDWFAHQDGTGEWGLFVATEHARRAAVIHLQMTGAVEHLEGVTRGETQLTEGTHTG